MLRIIIDTNVFVSGLISSQGVPNKILTAWKEKKVTLLINHSILTEIQNVLSRPSIQKLHRLNHKQVQEFCKKIEQFSVLVTESNKLPSVSIDPGDLKFLDCAIVGQADYLVTGDKEVLDLKTIQNTRIMNPSTFYEACIKTI